MKKGIDVLAGVIDPGYTGEIKAILQNLGSQPVYFYKGDKVAQLILEEHASHVKAVEMQELAQTISFHFPACVNIHRLLVNTFGHPGGSTFDPPPK